MNKNGELNETITHDGNDYEVLSLDRISEAKFAVTATGAVRQVITVMRDRQPHRAILVDEHAIIDISWEDLGIQPLKLLEKVPVEFVAGTAVVTFHGHDILAIIPPDDAVLGMKFRCVEVTK